MLEHGAEIRRAAAREGQILHVAPELVEGADRHVRAQAVVALEDVDVELSREGVGRAEDGVGAGQKFAHQNAGGGHGGVDGDDEVLDALFLPRLGRLDEGHVAVAHQAVGIVDIVEGVRVRVQDLPRGGKAAEEFAVVHVVPCGDVELLQHGLAARAALADKGLHGGLGLRSRVLPLSVLPLAALALLLLLQIPEAVVVHEEGPLEGGDLVFRPPVGQQHAVDALRRQHLHFPPALAVELLPDGGVRPAKAGARQGVQDALRRGVAGEIPERRVPPAPLGQMAEQAVEHHVQLQAVHHRAAAQIAGREVGGVIIERLAVGRGADGDLVPRRGREGADGPAQIGQGHAELRAARPQDLQADGGEVFVFHHSSNRFARPAGARRCRDSSSSAVASVRPRFRARSSASERAASGISPSESSRRSISPSYAVRA